MIFKNSEVTIERVSPTKYCLVTPIGVFKQDAVTIASLAKKLGYINSKEKNKFLSYAMLTT